MQVTLDVVGDETYEFEVSNQTYADLVRELGFSIHEVAVLVDGQPVPEDQPVTAQHVEVLRLIAGG